MKNLITRVNCWIDDRLKQRDRSFMEATAHNAARQAIHYYTCLRTIEQWHKLLNEAEKRGDKYMSMADLIVGSGFWEDTQNVSKITT